VGEIDADRLLVRREGAMYADKQTLLESLPREWPDDCWPRIEAALQQARAKVVVLDDDPTGNQTVHGVDVLAHWSLDALKSTLQEPSPVIYILTNSRSLPAGQARILNREIAERLNRARQATGRDVALVSRSDSTLRGHYPAETDALIEALDTRIDATLIVPFFIEGGRLTIRDVHYVTEGDRLIPAAETEYARDATFGYRHSNLRNWVSERHGGAIAASDVASLSLADIRLGGPGAVAEKLTILTDGAVCIVNAASYRDLEVVVAGLLDAEARGKRFLYRTAASFVRVRGGIRPQPLLTHGDLDTQPGPGLIVVGSHVNKTTRQVARLQARTPVCTVELGVPAILDADQRAQAIAAAVATCEAALAAGEHALLITSRQLVAAAPGRVPLEIGEMVSRALVEVVQSIATRPAWVLAKGGITASDVATQGLGVQRASVLGQALPGIPVWRTGSESRWPELVYVVFPGNVGSDDALADIVSILEGTS
jgi:uncharacterized protein YgbK (DUF1537 family)